MELNTEQALRIPSEQIVLDGLLYIPNNALGLASSLVGANSDNRVL